MRIRSRKLRRAIAATELAFLAPVLLTFLAGLWEVGRYVMVQNILDNAARETGRLASSAAFFASNNKSNPAGGTFSLASPSTNGTCELQKKVLVYLAAAGVPTTGATVAVTNTGTVAAPRNWSYTWTAAGACTGSGYDPAVAADQLDRITVTVTLPYSNVTWSPLAMFFGSSQTMTASSSWMSMRDVPLSISTTIPTRPILTTDPLP